MVLATFCAGAETRAGGDPLVALCSARTPKCKHCLGNQINQFDILIKSFFWESASRADAFHLFLIIILYIFLIDYFS